MVCFFVHFGKMYLRYLLSSRGTAQKTKVKLIAVSIFYFLSTSKKQTENQTSNHQNLF